jgi:hypothetical protein
MSEDGAWFAPKRYGLGPGIPVSLQGWVLTIVFVAVVAALCLTLRNHPIQLVPSLVPPVVIFLVIGCQKTRGGCRWRWGMEE